MQVDFIMESSNAIGRGLRLIRPVIASRPGFVANGGSEASSLLRAIMSLGAARSGRNFIRFAASMVMPRWFAAFVATVLAWSPLLADDQATPLRLIRELSSPHEDFAFGMLKSGVSRLTWSRDGERLAGYVDNGLSIKLWSSDGSFQKLISRPIHFGLDSYVLSFFGGHDRLISSPAASSKSIEDKDKINDVAFSVMDADTGAVLKDIPGPNPGKTASRDNIAVHLALSPDERFAAVLFHKAAEPRVIVYATGDWNRIASLEVEAGGPEPTALTFSPDGRLLAVVSGPRGRVMLFDTASWRLLRTIEAYPEPNPPMHYISVTAVTFSPDSAMIAVGTFGGGTWTDMKVRPPDAPKTGPVISFPPDPLRIFKVSDGSKVSSVGSFPGGFLHQDQFAWLPNGRTILFLDAVGNIRVRRCLAETSSSVVGAVHQAGSIKLSGDGRELAVSYPDGVKLFDLSMILE